MQNQKRGTHTTKKYRKTPVISAPWLPELSDQVTCGIEFGPGPGGPDGPGGPVGGAFFEDRSSAGGS